MRRNIGLKLKSELRRRAELVARLLSAVERVSTLQLRHAEELARESLLSSSEIVPGSTPGAEQLLDLHYSMLNQKATHEVAAQLREITDRTVDAIASASAAKKLVHCCFVSLKPGFDLEEVEFVELRLSLRRV